MVKDLRLANISTIEEANRFLPQFIENHNFQFAKAPASEKDVHRSLSTNENLDLILVSKSDRVISKNLEICYKNDIYQLQEHERMNRLKNKTAQIVEDSEKGTLIFLHSRQHVTRILV